MIDLVPSTELIGRPLSFELCGVDGMRSVFADLAVEEL
jgi:hypothetical protein